MARSSSTTSAHSAADRQRLPVNPRRNKVPPEKRKRVATACNNCNVRRTKCTGHNPCLQCSLDSRECVYPAPVEKVTVLKEEWEALKQRCAELEALQENAGDSVFGQQRLLTPPTAHNIPGRTTSSSSKADTVAVDGNEQATEVRLLHDTDGTARYLGETSGATFLDSLKGFMFTIFPLAFHDNLPGLQSQRPGATFISSLGRYQTFDSRPLLLPSVDPLWLPSRTEMTVMLTGLRYFIQDGNGDFPSGGILFFGDMSAVPLDLRLNVPGIGPEADSQQRRLAFFHTAFAFASQLSPATVNTKQEGHLGEAFFARARALIGNPLDVTTYGTNDVPVLALMALYLIENNRRDAAYIYISTAMHISVMHGIHRGWGTDEMVKRTFWTVYIIDRWLSCLMGRPPTILDDAIRLDMPEDSPGLPPAAGLKAHIELARISGYIVCNSYRVTQRGKTADKVESYIHRALQLLSAWRATLPVFLQMSDHGFNKDRAGCALHMAQGQHIILTIRPIFFMAVKKAVADRFMSHEWSIDDHPQISLIRDCSDAARRNLRLGKWIMEISPGGKLLLPDLHHIFNAAIILMLHQIIFINLRTNDVTDIAFAIACFEREANTGSNYGKDCVKVLQDLSALVHQLRNLMFDIGGNQKNAPIPGEQILASLSNAVTSSFDSGGLTVEVPHIGAHQFQLPPDGDLFQEFRAWIDSNDLQFYDNFLH